MAWWITRLSDGLLVAAVVVFGAGLVLASDPVLAYAVVVAGTGLLIRAGAEWLQYGK